MSEKNYEILKKDLTNRVLCDIISNSEEVHEMSFINY